MILHIILFVIYFCFISCLLHSQSPETSSDIPTTRSEQPDDFSTQVKELMSQPSPKTLTTPVPLRYKELMQIPFDVLKAIASDKNLPLHNKSQLCSRLNNQLTRQDIEDKIQRA